MNKKWSGKSVSIEAYKIKEKELEQLLDELAEVIYDYICQQDQIKLVTTESSQTMKRTGTDGQI